MFQPLINANKIFNTFEGGMRFNVLINKYLYE